MFFDSLKIFRKLDVGFAVRKPEPDSVGREALRIRRPPHSTKFTRTSDIHE